MTDDKALLPGSYFNASLIPLYTFKGLNDKDTKYIASHAPKLHTLPAFFCKVVASKTKLIVNLASNWTQLLKNCPGFIVKIRNECELSSSARIYSIKIKRSDNSKESILPVEVMTEPGAPWNRYYTTKVDALDSDDVRKMPLGTAHKFKVLHIDNWPDGGSIGIDPLKTIVQQVDRLRATETEGVWIHCEAGIGRTGTLMAALMSKELVKSIESNSVYGKKMQHACDKELKVEAFEVGKRLVEHMRKHRPFMVQTAGQFGSVVDYIFKMLQDWQQKRLKEVKEKVCKESTDANYSLTCLPGVASETSDKEEGELASFSLIDEAGKQAEEKEDDDEKVHCTTEDHHQDGKKDRKRPQVEELENVAKRAKI